MTTTTASTSTSTSNLLRRSAFALGAATVLLGVSPSVASAQPGDFVQCVPTEFNPCTGVVDPDPEPVTPFVVVEDLVFCGVDENGIDPCDEEEPEPETPFEGPDELVACSLANPCDNGGSDNGGSGDEEEGDPAAPGIDEPVAGNPDFTG